MGNIDAIKQVEYIKEVLEELNKAKKKHPFFPRDILHQVAILNEESGEVTQAAVDYTYGGNMSANFREEVLQTMCVCLRMLDAIDHKKTWAKPERGVY